MRTAKIVEMQTGTTKNASKQTVDKTKKTTTTRKRRTVTAKNKQGKSSEKLEDENGSLREAVMKEVKKRRTELAKKLVDAAAEGNVTSARLVVQLSEGATEQKKKKKKTVSQAALLAAEPAWIDPEDIEGCMGELNTDL